MGTHKPAQEQLADFLKRVKWHGRYFSALCPFHADKEPSLFVYSDGAYCASCQKQYPLAVLRAKVTRQPPPKQVGDDFSPLTWRGMPDPAEVADIGYTTLLKYPEQSAYLRERKLDGKIEDCMLGWFAAWITIPIYDALHDFSGLVLRATPALEKTIGQRYASPPGQGNLLYVPDWARFLRAKRERHSIFLPFGMLDALTLSLLGFPTCTFTLGKRSDVKEVERLLGLHRAKFVIIPDRGEEITAQKLVANLGWRGEVAQVRWSDGCKDPNDMLMSGYEQNLIRQLIRYS